MASIQVGGGCVQVVVTITDEMTKAATGLKINQIDMLRAVFEDQFGIDPATLTMDEIMTTAKDVVRARPKEKPFVGGALDNPRSTVGGSRGG